MHIRVSPPVQQAGGIARSGVGDGTDDEVGVFHGGVVPVRDEGIHLAPGDLHGFLPVVALSAGQVLLPRLHDPCFLHDRRAARKPGRFIHLHRDRRIDFHARARQLAVPHPCVHVSQGEQSPRFLGPDVHRAPRLDRVEIHVAARIDLVGSDRFQLYDADHGADRDHEIGRKMDESVSHRRDQSQAAPVRSAIAVETVGADFHVDDFHGHPVPGFDALDEEGAARTRMPVGVHVHDGPGPQVLLGEVVLIVSAVGLHLDRLAGLEHASDIAICRVFGAGQVRGAGESAHEILLLLFYRMVYSWWRVVMTHS